MNSQLIITACGVFAAILAFALTFYIKHKDIFDKRIKMMFIVLFFVDLIVFVYALSFSPEEVNSPPMVVSLMPDKMNPQEAGTTIKWTATALDPEKDLVQYKFFLDGQQRTNWSYDSTWYWTTSSVDIGSHTIELKVKDGNHNADGDDSKDIDFSISPDAITWNDKGTALYYQGKYADALQAYEKAIDLDSNMAEAWNGKDAALNSLGRYDEALQACNKAIELKPDFAEAWNNKGAALNSLGRYDEALQACNKAIELKPDFAEAWGEKGYVLGQQDKYDEALQALDKAIEIKPDLAEAWGEKGYVLGQQGKWDEDLQACNKATDLKPDYPEAWNNKGWALKTLGRTTEADAAFARAKELGYSG